MNAQQTQYLLNFTAEASRATRNTQAKTLAPTEERHREHSSLLQKSYQMDKGE